MERPTNEIGHLNEVSKSAGLGDLIFGQTVAIRISTLRSVMRWLDHVENPEPAVTFNTDNYRSVDGLLEYTDAVAEAGDSDKGLPKTYSEVGIDASLPGDVKVVHHQLVGQDVTCESDNPGFYFSDDVDKVNCKDCLRLLIKQAPFEITGENLTDDMEVWSHVHGKWMPSDAGWAFDRAHFARHKSTPPPIQVWVQSNEGGGVVIDAVIEALHKQGVKADVHPWTKTHGDES